MNSGTLPSEGTNYAVCVVGAGPVGLSFALEAAEAGLRVVLLDAGGEDTGRRDKPPGRRRNDSIVDPDRHAPELQTTRVGVGGASWMWGGRCVTYESVDFEQRDFVPDSDWPIDFSAIEPWRAKAQEYFDCGAGGFTSDEPGWEGLGDLKMSQLERWARQPKLGPRLAALVAAHPLIDLLCDAPVVGVAFDADGTTVEGLRILSNGPPGIVRADRYVLAAGGMETLRLLLDAQRGQPAAFGGIDGPLGRYYMGHATGSIANVVLTDPADIADMDFRLDEHDSYVRRRFSLPAESLQEHKLLNCSFYLDNPPFYDYRHRNATLSAVFLALALAPVGRRILAEGIRLRHIGPAPRRYWPHLVNVLRGPVRATVDSADILRRRYLSKVRKPGFLLRNPGGTYAIHYHSEQVANPDSRVRLDGGRNADGTPSLEIDFRYTERDVDSVLRFHEVLDERLRSAGRGRIEYLYPPAGRAAAVWEQAIDGFHHIGTTRMSAVPADGVVDGDCRVHGVDNLFIASSSVLRTSAEANPTFTAVCLALRLAHHIAEMPSSADIEAVVHDPESAADVREPGGDPCRQGRRVKLAG
ncbi:GMC family oxidoreductase [Pseudarthrobacter sulfonivorans]|uniref:GMC oxidoreductase n=1 Tax=Pseudarthrobacter sulfonivorans TaxID=121292 RepID=UPI00168BBC7D|nr:GMC oxidoreductase [Pseudarthrobacter sulfonivorans]